MDTHIDDSRNDADASWPYGSILLWGTFGSRSPEGRRYHRRTTAALIIMVLSFLVFGAWADRGVISLALALTPGATFAFVGWEFVRYLQSLDELARRLQLDAIAWTYGIGMVAATLVAGFGMQSGHPATVNPAWFLVLEPVRGVVLYRLARRH